MTDTTAPDLAELISTIPAGRWFAIKRALDMTLEDITSDSLALLVVACNEQHRKDTGKDAWTELLGLSITGLTERLGLTTDEDESADVS